MAVTFLFTTKRLDSATAPRQEPGLLSGLEKPAMACGHPKGNEDVFRSPAGQGAEASRVKIGEHPTMSIDTARKEASKMVGKIVVGIDPQAQKRELRAELTFGELFTDFLESWAKLRKKTWEQDEANYNLYLTLWKGWTLNAIQKQHVATLHAKLGRNAGPYQANRLLALIHTVFAWAIDHRGFKGINPATGIEKFSEKKRERFLQPDELPTFFKAVEAEANETIRDFVLISLYVGARRSNTQAMRWDELDLDNGVWTIPDTKSGKSVMVPLCSPALEILKRRSAPPGDTANSFSPENPQATYRNRKRHEKDSRTSRH